MFHVKFNDFIYIDVLLSSLETAGAFSAVFLDRIDKYI